MNKTYFLDITAHEQVELDRLNKSWDVRTDFSKGVALRFIHLMRRRIAFLEQFKQMMQNGT